VSGSGDLVIGSSGDRKSKISPLTVSNQGFTVHNHTCGINFLSHLRGAPQNPRQSGMAWDEPGGGGGRQDRRNRASSHPRKPKAGFPGTRSSPTSRVIGKAETSPLINTDDTDRAWGKVQKLAAEAAESNEVKIPPAPAAWLRTPGPGSRGQSGQTWARCSVPGIPGGRFRGRF